MMERLGGVTMSEQPEHEEARRPNFKIGADAILRYDDGSCRPASRPEVLLYALLSKAEQERDDLERLCQRWIDTSEEWISVNQRNVERAETAERELERHLGTDTYVLFSEMERELERLRKERNETVDELGERILDQEDELERLRGLLRKWLATPGRIDPKRNNQLVADTKIALSADTRRKGG